MEFTIQKESFLNALKIAEHVSTTSGIQIILSYIYIEATEDNELTIKGSDLDLSVILKIKANVKKPGSITLPAKKLSEIVSKLPNDEVNFEASEDTNKAKITSGRTKFELMGRSALEYPAILTKEEIDAFTHNITLDIVPFINCIKQTIYAASVAENNSIYNGVYIKVDGDDILEMAATDGARLSNAIEKVENKEQKILDVIIPAKSLAEFLRFQSGSSGAKVEIMKKESQILFKIGENIMVSPSLNGQYPKYKQIIPKDNDKVVLINRTDFLNSLDRTSSMVDEKRKMIKLTFEDKQLSLVVDNSDLGESVDFIDIEFNGEEPLKVAFNSDFLIDALRNYSSEKVKIELKSSNSPVLIKPDDDKDYLALIMPIQIKE